MENRHSRFCWPNHANEATVAGGGWSTELPLSQVLSSVFAEVTQSVDTTPASTQMTVALRRFRPIGVVALAKHNLSAAARWRVRVYYDDTGTDLAIDTGWRDVWPAVYATSELEWEYDNYWSGTLDEDDRGDFTPLATCWLGDSYLARQVVIEIDDQANPDDCVRIGRLFLGDVWMPEYNISYGVQYGFQIGTEFETAGDADQTEYADIKTPKRTVNLSLDWLGEEEGFSRIMTMQRRQGLHGEILYAESTSAGQAAFSTTFIGRQVSVNPLAHPYYDIYTNAISLQEIL